MITEDTKNTFNKPLSGTHKKLINKLKYCNKE